MNRNNKGQFKRKPLVDKGILTIIGVVTFLVFYSLLPKTQTLKAEPQFTPFDLEQPTALIENVSTIQIESRDYCDLSFYSYKEGKVVTAPEGYITTIQELDCKDQQVLNKIAHYESQWNVNSVNPSNTYARGLYHVLPNTMDFCSIRYIEGERDCALFVMKNYPSWYLQGYKDAGSNFDLSFI